MRSMHILLKEFMEASLVKELKEDKEQLDNIQHSKLDYRVKIFKLLVVIVRPSFVKYLCKISDIDGLYLHFETPRAVNQN